MGRKVTTTELDRKLEALRLAILKLHRELEVLSSKVINAAVEAGDAARKRALENKDKSL